MTKTPKRMKTGLNDIKDILDVADSCDLVDELEIEYSEENKSLTLYLPEHAWEEFLWYIKIELVK